MGGDLHHKNCMQARLSEHTLLNNSTTDMKIESMEFKEAPQSTTVENSQSGGKLTAFDDVNPTTTVHESALSKPLMDYKDMSDGVSNYLRRAQLIRTHVWSPSDPVGQILTFNPWVYIQGNTLIRERIRYFSTIRGKLRLRVITNGTPFQYGLMMLNYVPLAPLQHPNYRTKYTNTVLTGYQTQHVEINPTTSAPVEMLLDLYTPDDSIPLNVAADSVSLANLGNCYLYVVAPLLSANQAVADTITVQIYAWFEEIEFGVPTPESVVVQGTEQLGKGPVSTIASAVATGASYFKNVPIIGKFAMATEMGASAVGKIAGLFGYSDPILLERYNMYKEQTAINYCQSIGRDSSKKLTFDPMQELSIDPASVGFPPRDELTYAHLYKVPFYGRNMTWNVADVPGTVLGVIGVTPGQSSWDVVTPPIRHRLGPLGMLSLMTKWWTGPLKFRFKVIASAYHKGRIQFRYVPRRTGATLPGYGESTSQTVVMDIGLDSEKELIVNWSQPQLWQRTTISTGLLHSGLNSNVVNGGDATAMPSNCNGEIVVEVLTELTAPQLIAPVTIMVMMEGAEGLKFAYYFNNNQTQFVVQGVDDPELVMGNKKSVTVGGTGSVVENLMKVTFGEEIASLRSLFKRPMPIGVSSNIVGTQTAKQVFTRVVLPRQKSFPSSGPQIANNPVQSFYDMWRPAFVGEKGSVRYKIQRLVPNTFAVQNSQFIRSNFYGGPGNVGNPWVQLANPAAATVVNSDKILGWAQMKPTEGIYEVEVPDYNPRKYSATTAGMGGASYVTLQSDVAVLLDTIDNFTDTTANVLQYDLALSWGEDHTLLYFSGCPNFIQNSAFTPTPN